MSTPPRVIIEAPNKVLFIDDQPERIDHLYKAGVIKTWVTYAKDAFEGIGYIVDGAPWDVIFLDHDLKSFMQDPYPTEVTGQDVAHALTTVGWVPKLVIIHSMNSHGAEKIQYILDYANIKCMRIPVCSL